MVLRLAHAARRLILHPGTRAKRTLAIHGQVLVKKPQSVNASCTTPHHAWDAAASDRQLVWITKLISYIQSRSTHNNDQKIDRFVHEQLNTRLLKTSSQKDLYESVIQVLIGQSYSHAAATVYFRMLEEGFYPSNSTEAQVLTVLLAMPTPEPSLLDRIQEIVSDITFTDHLLLSLLDTINKYKIGNAPALAIMQSFLASKGPEYQPHPEILSAQMTAALETGNIHQLCESLNKANETDQMGIVLMCLQGKQHWKPDSFDNMRIIINQVISKSEYTDGDILSLLQTVAELKMDPAAIASMAESYLANRGPHYVPDKPLLVRALVEIFIWAGQVDRAFKVLDLVRHERPKYRGAHVAFLAAIRDTHPGDDDSIWKVLNLMKETNMPTDSEMINILISRDVKIGRRITALKMYAHMMATPNLHPDDYTFGSLFAIFRRVPSRNLKARRNRGIVDPVTIRSLYRDLMASTNRTRDPIELHTPLLNAALRAFMRQRDYVGALVVIKTFVQRGVPLDNRTYYAVFKPLIRRVWADILRRRRRGEVHWADRFLGVGIIQRNKLDEHLVHQMLDHVSRLDFDVAAPLYLHKPSKIRTVKRQFVLPTMEMMESFFPPEPLGFVYEPIPLSRVLARAAYAGTDVVKADAWVTVTDMVAVAQAEMFQNS